MRKLLLRLLLLPLLLWTLTCAAADDGFVPIPPLASHVTYQIGMLSAQQRAALEGVLAEYETRTGSQIAVLLMATTAPEAIEQYSIRLAEAWKLGRKGVDDGVILVVAKDNPKALRRLRIEAGRGVQGSLTDAQSKRILEDVIAPHFRQNDFYGGLAAGVSAIAGLLDKENLPAAQRQAQAAQDSQNDDGGWITLAVVLIFLAVFFAMLLKSRRNARNNLNNNDWGHGAGVIIGSILDQAARNASSGRSGGFTSSGGFGGSSGGFSSGGGSFSGGGGTFDGGGASGDW